MRVLFLLFLTVATWFLSTAAQAQAAQSQPVPSRFFLMGSGTMHLKNLRNNREARVHLLKADGSLNEADFNTVD